VKAGYDKAAQSGAPKDLQRAIALVSSSREGRRADYQRRVLTGGPGQADRCEDQGIDRRGRRRCHAGPGDRLRRLLATDYGELVKAGLPAQYEVLANVDDPIARKQLAER